MAYTIYPAGQQAALSPLLTPALIWNGTEGSGGSPPALDTTPRGTGVIWQPTCCGIFGDYMVWEQETELCVRANMADIDGIDYVELWLEGNSVILTQETWNAYATCPGYCFRIASRDGVDGGARLYMTAYPINGVPRRTSKQVTLATNGLLYTSIKYIDPVNGSDSFTGTSPTRVGSTSTGPWQSINRGIALAAAATKVQLLAGDHTTNQQNNQYVPVNQALPIIVENYPGVAKEDIVIKRPNALGSGGGVGGQDWSIRSSKVYFRNFTINNEETITITGVAREINAPIRPGAYNFENIDFTAPLYGYAGPPYGYRGFLPYLFQVDGTNAAQRYYTRDCVFYGPTGSGTAGEIRTTKEFSFDSISVGAGGVHDGFYAINGHYIAKGNFYIRFTTPETVEVASASYNAGTDRGTITLANTPSMSTLTGNNEYKIRVEASSTVPVGTIWLLSSSNDGTDTLVVQDGTTIIIPAVEGVGRDASLVANLQPGDQLFFYILAHGDFLQYFSENTEPNRPVTTGGTHNTTVYGNEFRGDIPGGVTQMCLFQPGSVQGPGLLSASGVNLSFSANHYLAIDEAVRLGPAAGAAAYEARRVIATPTPTTATINEAFTGGTVTSQSWKKGRHQFSTSVINNIWHGVTATGQISGAQYGFLFAQNTMDGALLNLRYDKHPVFANMPILHMETALFKDNLLDTQADHGIPGVVFLNSQYDSGTAPASDPTSLVSPWTISADMLTTSASKPILTTPISAWDHFGRPKVIGDKVGASNT